MERIATMMVLGASVWACLRSASHAIYAPSPADEPPRYCTVFTHLVKSGGSTIKNQLNRGSRKSRGHLPGLITGDARTTPLVRLEAIHNATIVVGHPELIREPLEANGRDCEFFTMLRNPIDRLISAFYYCPKDHDIQDRPSKWCGDSEGEEEPLKDRLLEFAKVRWGNKAMRSFTSAIACDPGFEVCKPDNTGGRKRTPKNVDTREGLLIHDRVKRVLSTYTAVGIFEEWELSMRLFDARVRSPVREWNADVKSNPGPRSTAREGLLQWAHTSVELHHVLAADLLLYDYGLALFRNQTRESLDTWS